MVGQLSWRVKALSIPEFFFTFQTFLLLQTGTKLWNTPEVYDWTLNLKKSALVSVISFHWHVNLFNVCLAILDFIIKSSFWHQKTWSLENLKGEYLSALHFSQICFQNMAFHQVPLPLTVSWDKALEKY